MSDLLVSFYAMQRAIDRTTDTFRRMGEDLLTMEDSCEEKDVIDVEYRELN